MKRTLLFFMLILLLVVPVSADYTLPIHALTNSPADSVSNYLGNRPAAPTTTVNVSIQFIPVAGTINIIEIYDYSGTAGTNHDYSYYFRLNNTTEYLINTTVVAANERVFMNTTMGISVSAGDFFEIRREHPAWTTNPLTNIVGGYVLVSTGDYGYTLFGQGLTNSPADSVQNYLGGNPIAPSTVEGTGKMYVPDSGNITSAYVNDYSGTAGTAESYSYKAVVNATPTLISALTEAANGRWFNNAALTIPVLRGNYFQFNRTHPAWATNPLTNIVGGIAFVNTTELPTSHGYPIFVEAITSSPEDGATVYFGNRPIVPSATAGTNKIYIRTPGTITQALVNANSGTAGTAESWTMYVRKNNAIDYPIATNAVSAGERTFGNFTIDVPVVAGDYLEIKSVQPTWVTNPLTTTYGGYLYQMYDGSPPEISFTSNVTNGIPPMAVQFTDSSITDITYRLWTATSTLNGTSFTFGADDAEPVVTFDTGRWDIRLSVGNASDNRTSLAEYIVVANPSDGYTGFESQDIWMTGAYTQTFMFTDATTGTVIPVVTIEDIEGTVLNTTSSGTGTLSTTWFQAETLIFRSDGYTAKAIAYIFDGDTTYHVTLSPSSSSSTGNATELSGDIGISGTPKDVRFHVTTFFGEPIPEATMYAQGISTTTGSFDWVASLFSIDFNETPIQNTSMYDNTDSNGDIVFLMVPSIKYNITTVASGYTFPSTIIFPQAKEYMIVANLNTTWFGGGNDTLADVNVSVSWVKINDTHSFANITYLDSSATTTSGDIAVYEYAVGSVSNTTPIAIMNITSSSCSNSAILETPTGGVDYTVVATSTLSSGEEVVRTFTHYFKGSPVSLPGWTSETLLWLSLFIIIFTAGFAGALHSPQMSVILCVEAWIFWGIGWLDALLTEYGVIGETVVILALTAATVLAFLWNVAEGKAKAKRSS
jgi:hypothetical protein